MSKPKKEELGAALARIEAALLALAGRVERLEARGGAAEARAPAPAAPPAQAPAPAAPVAPAPVAAAPVPEALSEEELLAVSAALAAFLGVRVRIRHIRLLSTAAWAQQGRVSIQASHHLHS
jgi:methylmalonyl-CoA carboxyltransferase 12S subunit